MNIRKLKKLKKNPKLFFNDMMKKRKSKVTNIKKLNGSYNIVVFSSDDEHKTSNYNFIKNIRDYENIRSVIDCYETRFTGILTKSGFKYGVVFNTINEDAGNLIHPDFSYYRPEEILNQQVPFIKVKVFQVNSEQTNYIKSQINNLTDFPMSVLNEQLISNVYSITDATVENKDFFSRIKKLVRRIFRT